MIFLKVLFPDNEIRTNISLVLCV